jgi:hypothetical protein
MGAQAQGGGKGGANAYHNQNPFEQSSRNLGAASYGFGQAMDFNPYQIQGGGFGGGGVGGQSVGNWGYDPAQAQGIQGPAGSYSSQSLAGTDMSNYMNPYLQQVVDTTMAGMDRQRQQAINSTGAQATAGGAFGGGRHAAMEAMTNADALQNQGQLEAQLRQQGFQNAQQMAGQDIANQNQASQFNLGQLMQQNLANLQNRQYNTGAQNQAAQFGQQAGLQQSIANASNQTQAGIAGMNNRLQAELGNQRAHQNAADFRLRGSEAMNNLGLQNFDIGSQVQQGNRAQGNFERLLNQGILDNAQGQFQGHVNAPQQAIDMLNSIFNPSGQGTSSSQPGVMDYLGTAIAAYAAFSDRRLKDNVEKVGTWRGHNLYRWTWNKLAQSLSKRLGPEIGVMAQEVAENRPEAVTRSPEGYLMVNYGAL